MAVQTILNDINLIIKTLDEIVIDDRTSANPIEFIKHCVALADQLDLLLKENKANLIFFMEKIIDLAGNKINKYILKLQKLTEEHDQTTNSIVIRFKNAWKQFIEIFKEELSHQAEAAAATPNTLDIDFLHLSVEHDLTFDPIILEELTKTIESIEITQLDENNLLNILSLYGKLKDYFKFLTEQINATSFKNDYAHLKLNATGDAHESNPNNNQIIINTAREIHKNGLAVGEEKLIEFIKLMPRMQRCLRKIEVEIKQQRASRAITSHALPVSTVTLPEPIAAPKPDIFKFVVTLDTPVLAYDWNQSKDTYATISKKIAANESNIYRVTAGELAIRLINDILANKEYGLGEIILRNNIVADLLEKAGIIQGDGTEHTFEGRYQAIHKLAEYFRDGKTSIVHDESIPKDYQKAILCLALLSIIPGISLQKRIETLDEIADIYRQNGNEIECLIYLHYCLQTLNDQLPAQATVIKNKAAEIFLNMENFPSEGFASPKKWYKRFAPNLESDINLYTVFYLYMKFINKDSNKKSFREYLCERGGGLAILTIYLNLHLQYNSRFKAFEKLFERTYEMLKSACEILAEESPKSPWKSLLTKMKQKKPVSNKFIDCAYHIFNTYAIRTPLMNTPFINAIEVPVLRVVELGLCIINYSSLNPNSPKTVKSKIYPKLIDICSKSANSHLLHEATLYTLLLAIHENNTAIPIREIIKHLQTLSNLRSSMRKSLRFQNRNEPIQELIQLWKNLDQSRWSAESYQELILFYTYPPHDFSIPHAFLICKALTEIYNKIQKSLAPAPIAVAAPNPAAANASVTTKLLPPVSPPMAATPTSKNTPPESPSTSSTEDKEKKSVNAKPVVTALATKPIKAQLYTKKWRKGELPEQADEEIRNILNLLYRLTGGRWYRDGDGNIVFPNLVEFGDFTLPHAQKGTYRATHRLLKILFKRWNYDGKFMPTQLPPGFKLGEYTWTGHIGRFLRRNYLWFVAPVPLLETAVFTAILGTRPWHSELYKFIKDVIYSAFEVAIGPTNSDRLIDQIVPIVLGIITDGGVVTAVFTIVTTFYFLYALAYPSLFQDSPDSNAIRYNQENKRFQVRYGQRRHLMEIQDIRDTFKKEKMEEGEEEFPFMTDKIKSDNATVSSYIGINDDDDKGDEETAQTHLGNSMYRGDLNPSDGIQTIETENIHQRLYALLTQLNAIQSSINQVHLSNAGHPHLRHHAAQLRVSDASLLDRMAKACQNLNNVVKQLELFTQDNPNIQLSEKIQEQINRADYLGKKIIAGLQSGKASNEQMNFLIDAAKDLKDALTGIQSLLALQTAAGRVRSAFDRFGFLRERAPESPNEALPLLFSSAAPVQIGNINASLDSCLDNMDLMEEQETERQIPSQAPHP